MENNKADLIELCGYGDIASSYQAADKFYIDSFTSVPYTLQGNIESEVNNIYPKE